MIDGVALARRYVEAGAAWLDAHYPGWDVVIDVPGLNLRLETQCVFGQIGGSYANMILKHGLSHPDAITLGVFGARGLQEWGSSGIYMAPNDLLVTYWRELIVSRRLNCSPCDALRFGVEGVYAVV